MWAARWEVAQDAPVAVGVLGVAGEHGDVGAGAGAVLRHQAQEGVGVDQGAVAVERQHGVYRAVEHGPRLEHGMPGAQLLRLLHVFHAVADDGAHLVAAVADDEHGAAGGEGGDGAQHMRHQGQPHQRVDHLWPARAHPLAQPRRQDHGGQAGRLGGCQLGDLYS